MATRDSIKHVVSASEPQGLTLGDEYYNTTNNTLYKRVAINGTTPAFISLTNSALTVDSNGVVRVTTGLGAASLGTGSFIVQGGTTITENLWVGGTLTVTNLAYTGTTTVSVSTISAAGTNQSTATEITTDLVIVGTVASGTGVRLPTASAGRRIVVRNSGANALNIYPSSGAQINVLAANTAFVEDTSTTLEFIGFSATQWYTVNATFA